MDPANLGNYQSPVFIRPPPGRHGKTKKIVNTEGLTKEDRTCNIGGKALHSANDVRETSPVTKPQHTSLQALKTVINFLLRMIGFKQLDPNQLEEAADNLKEIANRIREERAQEQANQGAGQAPAPPEMTEELPPHLPPLPPKATPEATRQAVAEKIASKEEIPSQQSKTSQLPEALFEDHTHDSTQELPWVRNPNKHGLFVRASSKEKDSLTVYLKLSNGKCCCYAIKKNKLEDLNSRYAELRLQDQYQKKGEIYPFVKDIQAARGMTEKSKLLTNHDSTLFDVPKYILIEGPGKDKISVYSTVKDSIVLECNKDQILSDSEALNAEIEKIEAAQLASTPIQTQADSGASVNKDVHILQITLSKEQEPNEEIHAKANELIAIMENGAKQLIKGGIDFETAEKLKQAKKEAKNLLSDPRCQQVTKDAMKNVIKQYDNIVESVSVLKTLREISREIRKSTKTKKWAMMAVKRPTMSRFMRLLGSEGANDYTIISDLVGAYGADKTAWKTKWGAIRKKMWDASLESESFIQQGKKITWVTGSKSSSIPSILKVGELAPALSKQPALVPTGQLMKHNIVPLAGELCMGITDKGINQNALSGASFEYLDTCIGYATQKAYQFDADRELEIIRKAKEANFIIIPMLRVSVLRLLLMGAKTEAFPEIQEKLKWLIAQEPVDNINPDWMIQAALINKTCPKGLGTMGATQELQRGQVVAVPRSDHVLPKYGIVTHKNNDGTYHIIVDNEGTSKNIDPKDITVISNENLTREAESISPLSDSEKSDLASSIETNRQKLESILNLFGTIKPFKFGEAETELIEQPFPIVWGSLSTSLPTMRVHSDIIGEVAVKGKLELGRDIQVIFTNLENVAKLQERLKGQDVQVLSFEAAHFIRGRQEEGIFEQS